ncbi:LAMI_0B01310g1_1 [Lachancea mirantina]|uniref:LAMI_0B01310g1_1 n=1 Tax=Lachancea mirantina TaxID=1230905 RepID=A0A1G4ITL8_9SACH|nr:LAMI_0B01310g1_1 [Lachancea mirantina]
MSDKHKEQQLFQTMKHKHLGLGNESTTKEEWMIHVKRDTYYSLLAHSMSVEYLTLSRDNTSKRITEMELINKMCDDLCKKPRNGLQSDSRPIKIQRT